MDFRFDFAVSFSATKRDVACAIVTALRARGLAVFYDRDYEHEMIGNDGTSYLRTVYSLQSRYCVVLICREYDVRDWTNLERESIQARELRGERGILIPVLTEDHHPSWLPETRIYFDLSRRPLDELISILAQKAGRSSTAERSESLTPPRAIAGVAAPKARRVATRLQNKDVVPMFSYEQINQFPISSSLVFDALRFGEGPHAKKLPGSELNYLPFEISLIGDVGAPVSIDRFVPTNLAECESLNGSMHFFLPRVFVVEGRKPTKNSQVHVYVCTDQPYGTESEVCEDDRFRAKCRLCLGGMAAFIDPQGESRAPHGSESLRGLGCAAIVVAVAFINGEPEFRSRFVLAVRKGIRYSDDVLFTRDGNPIVSHPSDLLNSRFLFQSRERNGSSWDVFAADYNGDHMVSLMENEPSSWEGFEIRGIELARWIDSDTAEFWSNAAGRGEAERTVRKDPFGYRRVKKKRGR